MKNHVNFVFLGFLSCVLLISCSNSSAITEIKKDNITSQGTPTSPIEIPISESTNLSIGHDSYSYYQFTIPQNNYYTISISDISTSDVVGLYDINLCCDDTYQKNYDNSPVTNIIFPTTVQLYKNTKYYIKINNYNETEGLLLSINISATRPYPSLVELSIDTEYNGTIGKHGISYDRQYLSFTTESAGYYQIYFLHPSDPDYSGIYYSQMLFDFMPDSDFHSQGTAYGQYNEYSLLANTTYYITWSTIKHEPINYTVLVHKMD